MVERARDGDIQPVQSSPCNHAGQTAGYRECDHWLRAFLAQGRRSPVELFAAARNAGFSKDQVIRSKSRIGGISMRRGFATRGQWNWGLGIATTRK